MHFASFVKQKVQEKKSCLILGIDAHRTLLPDQHPDDMRDWVKGYFQDVMDLVHPHVVGVKINLAFLERMGLSCYHILREWVRRARNLGLMIILDGKRGDIGSTMKAYYRAYLEPNPDADAYGTLGDALTVNSFLGGEVFDGIPETKGVFTLVRTSNPSARWQDYPLWEDPTSDELNTTVSQYMLRVARDCSEVDPDTGYTNIGVVIGATVRGRRTLVEEAQLSGSRQLLLLPGVGAQGGEITREDFDEEGFGALIPISRGICFPWTVDTNHAEFYGPSQWKLSVLKAAKDYNRMINATRGVPTSD